VRMGYEVEVPLKENLVLCPSSFSDLELRRNPQNNILAAFDYHSKKSGG
jgi:hypothetical protein